MDMRNLPARRVSIRCKEHPEWGTFGVMEDRGDYYDVYQSRRGWRTLSKSEAAQFWEVVPQADN